MPDKKPIIADNSSAVSEAKRHSTAELIAYFNNEHERYKDVVGGQERAAMAKATADRLAELEAALGLFADRAER